MVFLVLMVLGIELFFIMSFFRVIIFVVVKDFIRLMVGILSKWEISE